MHIIQKLSVAQRDLLGHTLFQRNKSGGMEKSVLYLIIKSLYSTSSNLGLEITCKNGGNINFKKWDNICEGKKKR